MPNITELVETYLSDTEKMRQLTDLGARLGEEKSERLDFAVKSNPLLQDISILKAEIGRK